jgi:hypothetical protein
MGQANHSTNHSWIPQIPWQPAADGASKPFNKSFMDSSNTLAACSAWGKQTWYVVVYPPICQIFHELVEKLVRWKPAHSLLLFSAAKLEIGQLFIAFLCKKSVCLWKLTHTSLTYYTHKYRNQCLPAPLISSRIFVFSLDVAKTFLWLVGKLGFESLEGEQDELKEEDLIE